MKRSIYFIIIFFFFSSGIALASNTEVILTPVAPTSPNPRAPSVNRTTVTATFDGSEVAICFSAPVGQATITLTGETVGIVYQETVDTGSALNFYIPVESFESGNYTVSVNYASIQLSGNVEL